MALQGSGSNVNGWTRPFYLTGNNYPITLSSWVRLPASTSTGGGFWGLAGSNALAFFIFYGTSLTGGNNELMLDLYDDTALEAGGAHPPPGRFSPFTSDGKWHHIGAQIITNLSPPPEGFGGHFWLDGVRLTGGGALPTNDGSIGFNLGAQTFTNLNIGVAPTDGVEPAFLTTHALAEVAVFTGGPVPVQMWDLTMQRLAQGVNPLRIPGRQNLLAYHPLHDNFRDLGPQRVGFGPLGSPPAAVWVDHPPIDPAPLAFRKLPVTHVAAALTSAVTSADSSTASLTNQIALAGTGASSDSATSAMVASPLGGFSRSAGSAIGALSVQSRLVATGASADQGLGLLGGTSIPLASNLAVSNNVGVAALTTPSVAANCQQMQNALVDALMRGQPLQAPTVWYIALVTQLGDTLNAGVEVSGPGYARVAVNASLTAWAGTQGQSTTAISNGISGLTTNNAQIFFPSASAPWGTVVGYEFWDQPSGGNRWIAGKLNNALIINSGVHSFPIAGLSVALA